jgi:hypothetical protein
VTRKTLIFWLFELLSTTAIAVILVWGKKYIWFILIPTCFLVLLKYLQWRSSISDRYIAIRLQLDVLLQLLVGRYPTLRCTLHVPTFFGRNLKQAFDYIQFGSTYGRGRKFSTKKGIIGKSYKQKGPQVENFNTMQEYRDKMTTEYGYTQEETLIEGPTYVIPF